MPFNGSGTFVLAQPAFVTLTPISSSAMNSDLSDIATGLSSVVTTDGQSSITAPIKFANGSLGAPAISFVSDTNTGIYRVTTDTIGIAAGAVKTVEISPTGVSITGTLAVSAAGWINTVDIANKAVTYIKMQQPSGASKILGSSAVVGMSITGAVNNGSGLIRLTVADTSALTTGQKKSVTGVVGTTEANGTWTITVIDATHVDLQGSTFTNAYVSGGTLGGSVEELTLGAGLLLSNANVLSAPSFPPTAAFAGLSIKVATTTTVAVVATFITVSTGSASQTLAFSGTINLGTTGANALDTGTVATSTWYAIFAIAKADGTAALLASTSAASPTLPTGYTYKARIGWVRTIAASATLYGTWQLGRQAQFVVGLAQTTVLPAIVASGGSAVGTINGTTFTGVAQSVSAVTPTTASRVRVIVANGGSSQIAAVAPNASYAGYNSTSNPAPTNMAMAGTGNAGTVAFDFLLESTNLYWASTGTNVFLQCMGWEDNI